MKEGWGTYPQLNDVLLGDELWFELSSFSHFLDEPQDFRAVMLTLCPLAPVKGKSDSFGCYMEPRCHIYETSYLNILLTSILKIGFTFSFCDVGEKILQLLWEKMGKKIPYRGLRISSRSFNRKETQTSSAMNNCWKGDWQWHWFQGGNWSTCLAETAACDLGCFVLL